jgi:predicted O-methyltransferase YrrM
MPVKRQDKPVSVLPLMQLTSGFWAFKTLAAAHELDLFGQLTGSRGTTPRELAASLGIADRPAEMLLTACTALGLLRKKGGRYTNSPLAEEYLVRGKPYYFGGLVEMLDKRLYPGWARLADALRTNRPTTWDPDRQASLFDGADPVMLSHFWEAMHSISSSTARLLAQAVDLRRFKRLLDVGGGSGAFDIELCRRYRGLHATVYDLPHVTEIAAAKIAQAGLADRVQTAPGDFFADAAYPAGHDLILLSLIMHDWSEEDDRAILRRCHDALPSGGAVVICELLVNDEKTGPAPAALMSLNMLIETAGGRNYTAAEYTAWLTDLGFRRIRTVRFASPGADGAVIAYKP